MSPNSGILLNGVLRPKLLNISFASCSLINLDFLVPHRAHFHDRIVLPFFLLNTFESTFFFCISNNMTTCLINDLCLIYEKVRINLVPTSFFIRILF